MCIFSNPFLDVGPAEEPIDNGSQLASHGAFWVSRVKWSTHSVQLLFVFQSNETWTQQSLG